MTFTEALEEYLTAREYLRFEQNKSTPSTMQCRFAEEQLEYSGTQLNELVASNARSGERDASGGQSDS